MNVSNCKHAKTIAISGAKQPQGWVIVSILSITRTCYIAHCRCYCHGSGAPGVNRFHAWSCELHTLLTSPSRSREQWEISANWRWIVWHCQSTPIYWLHSCEILAKIFPFTNGMNSLQCSTNVLFRHISYFISWLTHHQYSREPKGHNSVGRESSLFIIPLLWRHFLRYMYCGC